MCNIYPKYIKLHIDFYKYTSSCISIIYFYILMAACEYLINVSYLFSKTYITTE